MTATVKEITDSEVVFDNGLVTDLLGNTLKASDGRRFSPRQQFPVDYTVGHRWTSRFTASTRAGDAEGVSDTEAKIVARERITVPAGTFDAFRIEYHGKTVFAKQTTETSATRWMAPDKVRRAIALEETLKAGSKLLISQRTELLSYKQA